jgi:hypothetical protein
LRELWQRLCVACAITGSGDAKNAGLFKRNGTHLDNGRFRRSGKLQ